MCNVCGCGQGEGSTHQHGASDHHHHDGKVHSHASGPRANDEYSPSFVHSHHDHLHYGHGAAGAHAPGLSQTRMVQIERDVLAKNAQYARGNRDRLTEHGVLALNLVSSPGSGKTSLLTSTIEQLRQGPPLAVIEGDQQTANDAERIRATRGPAVQNNTGKGCHLDAHMVGHAMDSLSLEEGMVLFVENVGNLVCPAGFDLGEAHKVVILSITEGEDKPLKYPDMFAAADLMLLNKIDLLPHLDFDVDACIGYARQVNPDLGAIAVSATTGEGLDAWVEWIMSARRRVLEQRLETLHTQMTRLRARIEVADVSVARDVNRDAG